MRTVSPSILIHEYISGGGWPEQELPKSLMTEGLAMLRTVLTDFQSWGGAKVTTTRDRRLAHISLPADTIIDLDPSNHYTTLKRLATRCTAALIIAPESNGTLEHLSALMENQGALLLGCTPDSIAKAANKWECYRLFSQAGLATPETWCFHIKKARGAAEKIGFPLVIKPVDGVGCEGVNLIRNTESLLLALETHRFDNDHVLLQRYIEGKHVSASLIIAGNKATCLSLNKQSIRTGTPFCYQGGKIPFISEKHNEAVKLAKHAASLITGLQGYIGVDMLINDEQCYLIEINPRLTTSYIGLRQLININMAEAIWGASVEGLIPKKILLSGEATFETKDLV